MVWLVLLLVFAVLIAFCNGGGNDDVDSPNRSKPLKFNPRQSTTKPLPPPRPPPPPPPPPPTNDLDEMTAKRLQDQLDELKQRYAQLEKKCDSQIYNLMAEINYRTNTRGHLSVAVRYCDDTVNTCVGNIFNQIPALEHIVFVQNLWLPIKLFDQPHNVVGEVDKFGTYTKFDRHAILGINQLKDENANSSGIVVSSTIGFAYHSHGFESFAMNDMQYGFVWLRGEIAGQSLMLINALLADDHVHKNTSEYRKLIADTLKALAIKVNGATSLIIGGYFGLDRASMIVLLQEQFAGNRFTASRNIGSYRNKHNLYSYDYIVTSSRVAILVQPETMFRPYNYHSWLTGCETSINVSPTPNSKFGSQFKIET